MEIIKYLSVFFLSMLKFIPGIATGVAVGLSMLETILLSIAGMMLIVIIVSFLGRPLREMILRKFRKSNSKNFSKRRKFFRFWKKYGEFGIAFLSPVVFTPLLGTILISSTMRSKIKVYGYMFMSAVFWAVLFSFTFHLAYQKVF